MKPSRLVIGENRAKSIRKGESKLFLIGRIRFGSASGTGYEQTFCLALDPETGNFSAWRANYNKRRRIDQPE